MEKREFYDFEINLDEVLSQTGAVDEYFQLRDLKSRRLFLHDDIRMESIEDVVKHILRYNTEDKGIPCEDRVPIVLFISSEGGEVYSGFELIDAIENSKTPVYTVNMGYHLSMAFLIGIAGKKRFATKNAKYLWHDGIMGGVNSYAKMRDQMEFQRQTEDRTRQFILDHTNISPELYDSKFRVEWYMYAEEAKALGITDYIIGEDCDIDEIV